jgi:uncharacterized protein
MPSVPTALGRAAAGLGHRPEIAGDLLAAPDVVDFVEVVAEACFASPAAHREAVAVARVWPAVLHGVKLSLGSAEGIDPERARRLGALARELRAPAVTEHVAFVRAGGREIGHLTQVPLTREMVEVVARNVAEARRALPDVPFYLENPAWTLRWPGDEMDEASFFGEIAERTGCGLLLDLGNLYANAVNAGADPEAALRAFPLDRVAMVHLAGGAREQGFYFDTHAHPVPDAVLDLLARLVARVGPVPVVLERDDQFPPFADLAAEVARARQILRSVAPLPRPGASPVAPTSPARPPSPRPPSEGLAAAQAEVARMLTDPEAPAPEAALPFGEEAIARSREVLRRKRVDDALPLLQRLAPHREMVRPLALACVEGTPRARAMAGVADALRIAAAAGREGGIADPRIAAEARVDLLLLRSRFVGPAKDGSLRPRAAPFVGRERLPGGRVVWVVKGPGGGADVRIFETRR